MTTNISFGDTIDMNNTGGILIVEDDQTDAAILKVYVERLYPMYEIYAASSVQQAYTLFKKNDIDLILLDLNLPDGYGPNTVEEIKRFNRSVPIVVVTTLGSDITLEESLKRGASSFILKSQVGEDAFGEVLSKYIRR